MVLESLLTPLKAEKKPVMMILLGIIYAAVAAFLGLKFFRGESSFVFVFFTALPAVPLLWRLMRYEEKKDFEIEDEVGLLKQHAKALRVMMYLFIGTVIASAILFLLLSTSSSNDLFQSQTQTLNGINPHQTVGRATNFGADMLVFNKIFFNNLKVLMFCVLFSFLFGAGAIFILTWNATVIGVAIGDFIYKEIALITTGTGGFWAYTQIILFGFLKYIVHGIPEIAAYVVGALAAGIVSWATVKHDLKSRKFEKIVLDASDLFLVALIILFVAAILEVWVTPLIF